MARIRRTRSEQPRRVCFSKRRFELFEKATELAIMCGAEVAIVGFSPAGKAYSFGHPSLEAILERFVPTGVGCGGGGGVGTGEDGQLAELCRRYEELRVMVAAEKARKELLDAAMEKERAKAVSPAVAWLEADIRDLGEAALKNYNPNMDIQIQGQMRISMEIPPPPGFVPRSVWVSNDAGAGAQLLGPY